MSLVHCTHVLVSVLQTVVPVSAAQDVSLVHCTHLLVSVLHSVVVEPVVMQAATSVAVHCTQRFVSVLQTGVSVRDAPWEDSVHSAIGKVQ